MYNIKIDRISRWAIEGDYLVRWDLESPADNNEPENATLLISSDIYTSGMYTMVLASYEDDNFVSLIIFNNNCKEVS